MGAAVGLWLAVAGCARAEEAGKQLTLAASDEAAPILNDLVPKFQEQSGIKIDLTIRPSAVATELARQGKVDAVMTDDPESEDALLKSKDASKRLDVMYAELIIVGPAADPARIAGMASAVHAFAAIGRTQSTFISRGDQSGVHRTERGIWSEAGFAKPEDTGRWYREVKGDMNAVLAAAAERSAYTLADKAAWLQFTRRGQLVVMVSDDPRLQQRFSITLINPEKHKGVRAEAAEKLAAWLITRETQLAIGRYALNGEQPYIPQFGLSGK
ncbi:MAG: substrate-binding domain-containing protein [Rhodospirillaceae bacterium]|nr:substrate-binding domain-containing protein [Rhodospirillaceae bacterium]